MKNYYDILGVNRFSSQREIKTAYKKLANLYHPDKGEQSDSTMFLLIKEAYQALSKTKSTKKHYDFSMFKNSSKNEKNLSKMIIELTLEEAYNGCLKTVVNKKSKKTYLVEIPSKSCVSDIVYIETEEGDIEITITHKNTKYSYVDNNHSIIAVTEIDYITMLTGGKVYLDILGKKIPYNVRECCPNDLTLDLPDPEFNGYQLKAKIKTKIPQKLTEDEKDLLSLIKKKQRR